MSERKVFDDQAQEMLSILLENFWILRAKEPEVYQAIRERENILKEYVLDKLGYQLIVHRHFVKLEKIPAEPQAWMGIEEFQQPRDYAILCCVLAYLESLDADEQFLLSDLCTEVKALYPGEVTLDWRNYEHRKSLVRVLQFVTNLGMLKVVDGDTGSFNNAEEAEVLYEASVVARYFMRTYPKDLAQFHSQEELLAADLIAGDEEVTGARRRHRIYRQLLLTPAMYKHPGEDPDFLYLRNMRARLQDDLDKHTGLQLELYRQTAMLVAPEPRAHLTLFPDQKSICDLALQLSAYVREERLHGRRQLDEQGRLVLSEVEFVQAVKACQQKYGRGWSKQYREGLLKDTAAELLELLRGWQMAAVDKATGRVYLLPAFARLTGDYPADFLVKENAQDEPSAVAAE